MIVDILKRASAKLPKNIRRALQYEENEDYAFVLFLGTTNSPNSSGNLKICEKTIYASFSMIKHEEGTYTYRICKKQKGRRLLEVVEKSEMAPCCEQRINAAASTFFSSFLPEYDS